MSQMTFPLSVGNGNKEPQSGQNRESSLATADFFLVATPSSFFTTTRSLGIAMIDLACPFSFLFSLS